MKVFLRDALSRSRPSEPMFLFITEHQGDLEADVELLLEGDFGVDSVEGFEVVQEAGDFEVVEAVEDTRLLIKSI